jgi:hypothetical protein
MSEQRDPSAQPAGPEAPFRLTMRSDSARRTTLCAILLGLSLCMVLAGLAREVPQWGYLICAVVFALPGFALAPGLIRPVVYELVLDRGALRWGKQGGEPRVVVRSEVTGMYFGDDGGAADLVTGESAQLPMEIVGGSIRALSQATARLWPDVPISTRFAEDALPPDPI